MSNPTNQQILIGETPRHLDGVPLLPEPVTPDVLTIELEHARSGVPNRFPGLKIASKYTGDQHFGTEVTGTPYTFRIPDELSRAIDLLLAGGYVPYKTKSAFLRDAAYYLLEGIRELVQIGDARLLAILRAADEEATLHHSASLESRLWESERVITGYLIHVISRKDLLSACHYLSDRIRAVKAMPIAYERALWRTMLERNPIVSTILELAATWKIPHETFD